MSSTADKPAAAYTYISRKPGVCGGKPCIDGHRIRVQDVSTLYEHHGRTADEICDMFPTITLAQVHAALTYYYDHREEIEREINEGDRFVEQFIKDHPDSVRQI